jgi:hypothetical protein
MLSRDSSVGIATGYGLNGRNLIDRGKRFFSILQRPDRLWGLRSLIQLELGALSPTVKRQGREADRSHYLVPRCRELELHLHFPVCLHSLVLN